MTIDWVASLQLCYRCYTEMWDEDIADNHTSCYHQSGCFGREMDGIDYRPLSASWRWFIHATVLESGVETHDGPAPRRANGTVAVTYIPNWLHGLVHRLDPVLVDEDRALKSVLQLTLSDPSARPAITALLDLGADVAQIGAFAEAQLQ